MEAMRNFFTTRPVQPASPTTTTSDTPDLNSSSSTTPTPTITTATATATITTHQPADHPRDLLSDSEISALDLGPSVMDNTTDNTNTTTKPSGKNDVLPEVTVTPPSGSDSSTPVAVSVLEVKNGSHEHVDRSGVKQEEGVTGSTSENTPLSSSSASSRNGSGNGNEDGKKARGRGGTVGLVFRTISSPLLSPLRTSMNGSSSDSSVSSSAGVSVEGKGGSSRRPGVNRARTSFRWRGWRKETES